MRKSDDWSVNDVGKQWQFRFFHILIRVGGLRPAYHVMYIVVLWYVVFMPAIRERAQHYLRRRFPDHDGFLHRFWDSYRLVINFARTMIDRAAHMLVPGQLFRAKTFDMDGIRNLVREHDGAILLNAHVGSWQVAMTSICNIDCPVSFVMIPPEGGVSSGELAGADLPFDIIDPRRGAECFLDMIKALENGSILGFMGDRVFGKEERAVDVDFLGSSIKIPFIPFRMAAITGKPMMVLFSHKEKINICELHLAAVIQVPGNVKEPEDGAPYAQQFADALEGYVEEHPWQFFNFYDMWDSPTSHVVKNNEDG